MMNEMSNFPDLEVLILKFAVFYLELMLTIEEELFIPGLDIRDSIEWLELSMDA